MTPRPGLLRGSKIKNYKGSNALRVTWSPPPGFSTRCLADSLILAMRSAVVQTRQTPLTALTPSALPRLRPTMPSRCASRRLCHFYDV